MGEKIIRVLEYSGDVFESSFAKMAFSHKKWVDLTNPTEREIRETAEKLEIDAEEIRQSLDPRERPRIDELEHFTVIVFRTPSHKKIKSSAIGFFLSDHLLLTVHQHESHVINGLFNESMKEAFHAGTSNVLMKVLEKEMHEYFQLLDKIEDDIDKVEKKVFDDPRRETVKEIFKLKKTLIFLHKSLVANRDVMYKLESSRLAKHAQGLRYIHDDLLQMVDMVATYKDLLTGALDIYLSSVSNNMNASMKRMTAWASIILIPTFITGLYGMNFAHMPELAWQYGYLFAWGTIILSTIILFTYFKKKNWF